MHKALFGWMDPKIKKNGKKLLGSNAVTWRFMVRSSPANIIQCSNSSWSAVVLGGYCALADHQCAPHVQLAPAGGHKPTAIALLLLHAAAAGAVGGCAGSHVWHLIQPGAGCAGAADVARHGSACAVQAGALQVRDKPARCQQHRCCRNLTGVDRVGRNTGTPATVTVGTLELSNAVIKGMGCYVPAGHTAAFLFDAAVMLHRPASLSLHVLLLLFVL